MTDTTNFKTIEQAKSFIDSRTHGSQYKDKIHVEVDVETEKAIVLDKRKSTLILFVFLSIFIIRLITPIGLLNLMLSMSLFILFCYNLGRYMCNILYLTAPKLWDLVYEGNKNKNNQKTSGNVENIVLLILPNIKKYSTDLAIRLSGNIRVSAYLFITYDKILKIIIFMILLSIT